jgi:hypothetical protein
MESMTGKDRRESEVGAGSVEVILARHLNANHPFRNSKFFYSSIANLLDLLHIDEFEISAPQCRTHSSPTGNSDVLDMIVHTLLFS